MNMREKEIEERKRQLLHNIALMAEIDAQERCIRRFKRRHPIRYWRWLRTPTGRQYKLTKDIQDGKILGMIS